MKRYNRYLIAKWYYYATPLFILLDYFLGINVRISALDAMPLYKYAYYGFCILCGVCIYIAPRYSPIVALLESVINYVLMILLLLMPYIRCLMQEDIIGEGWQNVESLSPEQITNLLIAAVVAAYAFRASIHKLAADFAAANQPQIQLPPSDTNKRHNRSTSH